MLANIPPLLFHSIIVLISIGIVAKAGDLIVYGISDYARKLGISDYLIGLFVVSIGTALTELMASITGALAAQGAIVFGTVLGSSLFKFPILGLILLISRKIKTKENTTGSTPIITLFIIILPLILIGDGRLSRIEGAILLIAFVIYIAKLWKGEGELGKMKEDIKFKSIWKDMVIFGVALAALLLSARYLVLSSITISGILNVSPYFVGLIVIGIGASAPELTVQLRSILKKRHNIAFGNVIGSLVANSALVLGIAAMIKPIYIQPVTVFITSIFIMTGAIYTLIITGQKEVNWKHGLILISFYALFLLAEFIF